MAERMLLGTSEKWKRIDNAPNYWISTFGQILKDAPKIQRRNRRTGPKFIKPQVCQWGYAHYWEVRLTIGKKRKKFFVHRLVAKTFIPNPENKAEVNHKDGDKLNCSVDNLEWNTERENYEHAVATGLRGTFGTYKRKMNADDVRLIRAMSGYVSQEKMSFHFQLDQTSISDIILRKTYREVA